MEIIFKQKRVYETWLRKNLKLKVNEKLENIYLFPLSILLVSVQA